MAMLNDIKFILLACVTLGLAPFYPEPHIWGKLVWILGGAHGMGALDWFDVLFHGWPWVLLLRWIFITVYKRAKDGKEDVIQRVDKK
jgi:hypothetical protein